MGNDKAASGKEALTHLQAMSQEIANATGEPVTVDMVVGPLGAEPRPGDLWRGRMVSMGADAGSPSHIFRLHEEWGTPLGPGIRSTSDVLSPVWAFRTRKDPKAPVAHHWWRSLCGYTMDGGEAPNRDGTPPLCKRCQVALEKLKAEAGADGATVVVQGYTTWTFMPNEDGSGGSQAWSTFGLSQEEAGHDNGQ